jgi:hypothetical protein
MKSLCFVNADGALFTDVGRYMHSGIMIRISLNQQKKGCSNKEKMEGTTPMNTEFLEWLILSGCC